MRIEVNRKILTMILQEDYSLAVTFAPNSYFGGPHDPHYSIITHYTERFPQEDISRVYIFMKTFFFKKLIFDSYHSAGGDLLDIQDFDIESPIDFQTGEFLLSKDLILDFSSTQSLDNDLLRLYGISLEMKEEIEEEFKYWLKLSH